MPRQLTADEILRGLARLRIRSEELAARIVRALARIAELEARLAELGKIPYRSAPPPRRGRREDQAAKLRAKIDEMKARSSRPGPAHDDAPGETG